MSPPSTELVHGVNCGYRVLRSTTVHVRTVYGPAVLTVLNKYTVLNECTWACVPSGPSVEVNLELKGTVKV